MQDETIRTADQLIGEDDDVLFSEMERDARRYNKAFTEEEEAGE